MAAPRPVSASRPVCIVYTIATARRQRTGSASNGRGREVLRACLRKGFRLPDGRQHVILGVIIARTHSDIHKLCVIARNCVERHCKAKRHRQGRPRDQHPAYLLAAASHAHTLCVCVCACVLRLKPWYVFFQPRTGRLSRLKNKNKKNEKKVSRHSFAPPPTYHPNRHPAEHSRGSPPARPARLAAAAAMAASRADNRAPKSLKTERGEYRVVFAPSVAVRDSPWGRKVGTKAQGDVVQTDMRSVGGEGGGWVRLKGGYKGGEGWMLCDGAALGLGTLLEAVPRLTPQLARYRVVHGPHVMVRDRPSGVVVGQRAQGRLLRADLRRPGLLAELVSLVGCGVSFRGAAS